MREQLANESDIDKAVTAELPQPFCLPPLGESDDGYVYFITSEAGEGSGGNG